MMFMTTDTGDDCWTDHENRLRQLEILTIEAIITVSDSKIHNNVQRFPLFTPSLGPATLPLCSLTAAGVVDLRVQSGSGAK